MIFVIFQRTATVEVITTNLSSGSTYVFTKNYNNVIAIANIWRDATNSNILNFTFTLASGTSSTLFNEKKNYYESSGGLRVDLATNVKASDTFTLTRTSGGTGYSVLIGF